MKINARKILIRLQEEDTTRTSLSRRITDFCHERNIANYILTEDGYLLFVSDKQIKLNDGMNTLSKCLSLTETPTRVTDTDPLPDKFVQDYFQTEYDPERVRLKFGKVFEDAAIKKTISTALTYKKNAVENHTLRTKSTTDLVRSGVVPLANAPAVENAKRFLEELEMEKELNPDLKGEHSIVFSHYNVSRSVGKAVKTGMHPDVTVVLHGFPREVDVKLKHYYIYSKVPGFGKTHLLRGFAKAYNAFFLPDTKNWMGIPKGTQFIVLDEYGPKKKLSFEDLKTLTAGDASAFAGNRKSHGQSFKPRADVQLVILSNKSIYELYGTWNPKIQKCELTAEEADQLDDRFQVTRLDGDVREDRRRALGPASWTDDEFDQELRRTLQKHMSLDYHSPGPQKLPLTSSCLS